MSGARDDEVEGFAEYVGTDRAFPSAPRSAGAPTSVTLDGRRTCAAALVDAVEGIVDADVEASVGLVSIEMGCSRTALRGRAVASASSIADPSWPWPMLGLALDAAGATWSMSSNSRRAM